MKKKILVDMSCTILHHGHIRLIKKASNYGNVYIALTTDKEIKKWDNDMNNGTNEEMKEIKMNNNSNMYKFRFFLNGFHLIWFDKKNSDDMINDIKNFMNKYCV